MFPHVRTRRRAQSDGGDPLACSRWRLPSQLSNWQAIRGSAPRDEPGQALRCMSRAVAGTHRREVERSTAPTVARTSVRRHQICARAEPASPRSARGRVSLRSPSDRRRYCRAIPAGVPRNCRATDGNLPLVTTSWPGIGRALVRGFGDLPAPKGARSWSFKIGQVCSLFVEEKGRPKDSHLPGGGFCLTLLKSAFRPSGHQAPHSSRREWFARRWSGHNAIRRAPDRA